MIPPALQLAVPRYGFFIHRWQAGRRNPSRCMYAIPLVSFGYCPAFVAGIFFAGTRWAIRLGVPGLSRIAAGSSPATGPNSQFRFHT